jgi:3-oxoacyl-[acyl-carrier-protein] synthase-3
MHYLQQDGPRVFRFATRSMAEASEEILKRNGLRAENIALFVPQQAGRPTIDAYIRRMKLPEDKVLINIERYANTVAASIPIALSEAIDEGRVNPKDLVLFASAGAGFGWGSVLLEWA